LSSRPTKPSRGVLPQKKKEKEKNMEKKTLERKQEK